MRPWLELQIRIRTPGEGPQLSGLALIAAVSRRNIKRHGAACRWRHRQAADRIRCRRRWIGRAPRRDSCCCRLGADSPRSPAVGNEDGPVRNRCRQVTPPKVVGVKSRPRCHLRLGSGPICPVRSLSTGPMHARAFFGPSATC